MSRFRSLAATLPALGASLLPVGACPACWPIYTALLGSLGAGFLLEAHYLLPLSTALLALAVFALAWKAPSRRGYGPTLLGLLASAIALAGKFASSSDPVLYLGAALLISAALWNAWPHSAAAAVSCPACARQDQLSENRAHEMESIR